LKQYVSKTRYLSLISPEGEKTKEGGPFLSSVLSIDSNPFLALLALLNTLLG